MLNINPFAAWRLATVNTTVRCTSRFNNNVNTNMFQSGSLTLLQLNWNLFDLSCLPILVLNWFILTKMISWTNKLLQTIYDKYLEGLSTAKHHKLHNSLLLRFKTYNHTSSMPCISNTGVHIMKHFTGSQSDDVNLLVMECKPPHWS